VIAGAKKADPDKTRFGWIPYLAKTWVGRFLAKSLSERMISHANIVMKPGFCATNILQSNCLCSKQCINQHFGPFGRKLHSQSEKIEMLVVLRMNRRFMEYMRTRHNQMSIESLKRLLRDMWEDFVPAESAAESEDDNVPWTLVKVLTKST
jgi:hypothetical protein